METGATTFPDSTLQPKKNSGKPTYDSRQIVRSRVFSLRSVHPGAICMKISSEHFGYKYDTCLANSVGVIDADYYNNPDNEGHFSVKLINHGKKDLEINVGDRIAQGVFTKFLLVDEEEEIVNERVSGFGSTGKGDNDGR